MLANSVGDGECLVVSIVWKCVMLNRVGGDGCVVTKSVGDDGVLMDRVGDDECVMMNRVEGDFTVQKKTD